MSFRAVRMPDIRAAPNYLERTPLLFARNVDAQVTEGSTSAILHQGHRDVPTVAGLSVFAWQLCELWSLCQAHHLQAQARSALRRITLRIPAASAGPWRLTADVRRSARSQVACRPEASTPGGAAPPTPPAGPSRSRTLLARAVVVKGFTRNSSSGPRTPRESMTPPQ